MNKLYFLLNSFPKVSETFILREVVAVKKNGIDLDIISLNKSTDKVYHAEVINYKLLNNLINIYSKNKFYSYLKFANSFLYNFLHFPILFYKILKTRNRRLIFELGILIKYFKDSKQDDILYCHFGSIGIIGMNLVKYKIFRGKLAVVFHGMDISEIIKKNGDDYYTELFKYAKYVLPISVYWQNKLIQLGCSENKIQVHRMGVSSDFFKFTNNRTQFNNGCVRIMTVSRLVEKKGLIYAIDALYILKQKGVKFQYRIIGNGPLRKILIDYVYSLDLEENISFVGELTQLQVQDEFYKNDIFLLPSITASNGDMEGLPVAIMEACALRTPVISTYHSGIPELIIDKYSGFLSNEKDVNGLVSSILKCIEMYNDNSIDLIVNNAYRKVNAEFNSDKNIETLLNLFCDI